MPNSDSIPSDAARSAAQLLDRIARLSQAADRAAGLNPAQAEALRYLGRANRFSRTPAALADYLGSTRGTVSQTLLALEAKGLVEKSAYPGDGRAVALRLTWAGEAFLQADQSQYLAGMIDAEGTGEALATLLDGVLRAALAARGGAAFGVCRTCRHFREGAHGGTRPHHCGLLDAPLSEPEAGQICLEQTA
jgi:DNA-binding MarR family transcriptional regulator